MLGRELPKNIIFTCNICQSLGRAGFTLPFLCVFSIKKNLVKYLFSINRIFLFVFPHTVIHTFRKGGVHPNSFLSDSMTSFARFFGTKKLIIIRLAVIFSMLTPFFATLVKIFPAIPGVLAIFSP